MLQTIVPALILIAFIVWRFRRLLAVLQSGRSMMYKVVVGGVIGLFLVLRVARLTMFASSASASPPDDKSVKQAGQAAAAPAPTGPLADAMKLVADGQHALEKCDTTSATLAFQRAAGIGVEMMTADSLAGNPLYVQGLALAGLHDSTSAVVLTTEANRLDKKRGAAEDPERMTSTRHMIALARRKC